MPLIRREKIPDCWQIETMSERIYRLTKSGRDAWESQDTAVPADYRRLLWLMDFHGHTGLMRELVSSYPGQILDEWLDEQVPAGQEIERDFPSPRPDDTLGLDQVLLREETRKAASALARTGAYLA